MVGRTLGRYEILEPLGAGGMGEVYRAHDERLDRDVAIKVLPEAVARDPDRLARFEREAKAVARLSHPCILEIFELGEHEGCCFMVTEVLEGETLAECLEGGALGWRKAAEIGAVMADGLAAANAAGIVHRDLKPSNVFLTFDGRVKVLDFGLALTVEIAEPGKSREGETHTPTVGSHTEPGTTLGTIGYMSPEQVRGEPADHRSDIFSLGCVLYEMVCGRRAFARDTAAETIAAILRDEPADLHSLDSGTVSPLASIVRRCIEKRREARFQAAQDLAFALRSLHLDDARPSTRAGSDENSIVVLPFDNLSPDPDQDYFADGLTEEIIADLARVRSLKVISRTSAMLLKGTDKDLRTIGRELNVRYVLEGSVRRAGDALRITAQLIDAPSDVHLWAEKYTGTSSDVFDFQEQVSRSIVEALQLELSPAEAETLASRATTTPEAHEAYLKGRYYWNKRTAEAMSTALEFFQKAIDLDPCYAAAYSGMADVYNLRGILWNMPPNEAHPLAKAAAKRALELDDGLAEAHTSLAVASFVFDRDWEVAEREFLRAIEMSPSNASAHHFYGAYYSSSMGRFDEALAEMRLAYELDPLTPVHSSDTAGVLLFARRYEEAIEQGISTLEHFPEFPIIYFYLINAYVHAGRYDDAIAAGRKATEMTQGEPLYFTMMGYLGYALAASGRTEEARSILSGGEDAETDLPLPPYRMALIHTALGEMDRALDFLEEAEQQHTWEVGYLKVDPGVDPLRAEPRFQDLMRRMNFPVG